MNGERLRHLLAVAIDPSEDEDHEWCDEDSGGNHRFDRDWFERDARAALTEAPPSAVPGALSDARFENGRRLHADEIALRDGTHEPAVDDFGNQYLARAAVPGALREALDVERLAEAWANVMDGRRIGEGLHAARVNRETTTPDDWQAIAREYAALAREEATSE